MKELDKDGRILCELQGKIFERSAKEYTTSSAVFVRRYMNSDYAARMDREGFADRPTDVQDAFDSLDEQYGASQPMYRMHLTPLTSSMEPVSTEVWSIHRMNCSGSDISIDAGSMHMNYQAKLYIKYVM